MPRDAKPEPPSREEMAREYLESVGFSGRVLTAQDKVLIELDRLWKEKAATGEHPTSSDIAGRLGIAGGTVRQHLIKLAQEGRALRMDGGYYVPLEVPESSG